MHCALTTVHGVACVHAIAALLLFACTRKSRYVAMLIAVACWLSMGHYVCRATTPRHLRIYVCMVT